MSVIKLFYDLETTGVNVRLHSIHRISGLIEVDGEVVETIDIKTRPHPKAKIDPAALRICGVTEDEIMSYQPMKAALKQFLRVLGRYVDKYDKKQMIYLVGFNNRAFDDQFLRAWFLQNKNDFFGAYFYGDSLDVMVLASQYLIDTRPSMPSFKLHRVARTLGLDVDKQLLHEGSYDVQLTRDIYRIVTDLEL